MPSKRQPVPPAPARSGEPSRRILDAARVVFLAKGFTATTIDDVLALCKGSKSTVFRLFGSKEGLFAAAMLRQAEMIIESWPNFGDLEGPELGLYAVGDYLIQLFLRPEAVNNWRTVVASTINRPYISRSFYEKAHRQIIDHIAMFLKRWHAAGLVNSPDPHGDAERFVVLLMGHLFHELLFGVRGIPTPAERKKELERVVQIFLHGVARISADARAPDSGKGRLAAQEASAKGPSRAESRRR